MQLSYANPEETTVSVTLDEGDELGHLNGPGTWFVPTDLSNLDFAAIGEAGLPISPYVAPAVSPSVAIAASAQSLQLANAKSLAAQGRTDEALAALLNLMEQST